jgi:hypothetical protein
LPRLPEDAKADAIRFFTTNQREHAMSIVLHAKDQPRSKVLVTPDEGPLLVPKPRAVTNTDGAK